MPFYEYQCRNCQHYLEVMQKITDAPLRKCPSCGRMTLVKLISAPVFRLKGGGWYETDFKSDKENKRNLAGGDREESKTAEPAKGATQGTGQAAAGSSAPKPAAAAPAKAAPKRARPRARTKTSAPKRSTRSRPKR